MMQAPVYGKRYAQEESKRDMVKRLAASERAVLFEELIKLAKRAGGDFGGLVTLTLSPRRAVTVDATTAFYLLDILAKAGYVGRAAFRAKRA